MRNGRTWCAAVLFLTVLLVTPGFARHRLRSPTVVEAANVPPPLQNFQSWKGFVAARAERSMTVLDGGSAIQVVITEKTQIVGRRNSFAKIAIDDVVRVEGLLTSGRDLLANRVEVILAADGTRMAHPARTGPVNSLVSVILNGGITVPLR